MGMIRQIGGLLLAGFVFAAIITALSRLLVMKELPGYIDNSANGIANLFAGTFGVDSASGPRPRPRGRQ